MSKGIFILSGADLMSESGENPEYDRAIVELVSDSLGLSSDDHETVHTILKALKER